MQATLSNYYQHYLQWKLQQQKFSSANGRKVLWSAIQRVPAVLLSRFYLRKAFIQGLVICRSKPSLHVEGKLSIGNGSRLWSQISQTRLAVFKGASLQIGKHTFINGARIAAKTSIKIGNHVHIAPETVIMDSDFHDLSSHQDEGLSSAVVIGDHVWIATRAMILKGVHIGEGAVVAAGAVVTKNVAPFTVVAGIPAVVIKHLNKNK